MKKPSAKKMKQRLATMARRPAGKGYMTLLENCENDIPPNKTEDHQYYMKPHHQQHDQEVSSAAAPAIGNTSTAFDMSSIMSTTISSDVPWETPLKSKDNGTENLSGTSPSSSSSHEDSPVARSPEEHFFEQSFGNRLSETMYKTFSSADELSTEQSAVQNETLEDSFRKPPFLVTQFSSETFQKAYEKVCQYEQELLASQSFSTQHLPGLANNDNEYTTSQNMPRSFQHNNTKDRLCLDATFLDLTCTASNESEEIVLREMAINDHLSDDTTTTHKDCGVMRYRLDLEKMAIFRFSSVTQELVELILQKITDVEPITAQAETRRALMVVGETRAGQPQSITLVPYEQGTSFVWMEAIQRVLSTCRSKEYHMDESFNEPFCDPREGWIITESEPSPIPEKDKNTSPQTDSVQHWVDLAHLSEDAAEGRDLVVNLVVMEKASTVFFGKGPSFAPLAKPQDWSMEAETIGKEQSTEETPDVHAGDEVLYPKAIVERHQINKLSWTFYRNMCLLLQARMRYEEAYRRIQLDPTYPYLTSITGLADSGGEGQSLKNTHKEIQQRQLPDFRKMSRFEIAEHLLAQAEEAMPELVKLCENLANVMHFEDARVGPIKDIRTALAKADLKYGGNILKVTDFCRVSLVVKDLPALLALIECMEKTCSSSIRRVKLSSLKGDKAKKGGYRDCIVNVEIAQHLCEIQIHLLPMWMIGGMGGYVHYQNSRKHSIDDFDNPYKMLDRLDTQTQSEIMIIAEEAVSKTLFDSLGSKDERVLLDCFAQAGLFVRAGLLKWAEIIFRKLIEAYTNVSHLGPNHPETIMIYNRLIDTLWAQDNRDEIPRLQAHVEAYEQSRTKELETAKHSLWEYFVYDMIVDPSREDRETDEAYRREIKASKRIWKKIREEKFSFLIDSSGK